jgi:hypothetical protein
MSADTGSHTEADAGAYEQERGSGLVPIICGAPVYTVTTSRGPHECPCILPLSLSHHWHRCLHTATRDVS